MELQNNQTKYNLDNGKEQQQHQWYGSKTSCASEKRFVFANQSIRSLNNIFFSSDDTFMTFQSKDPIINIPLDKVPNKDKVPGGGGGGGHSHGIPVEHPTS